MLLLTILALLAAAAAWFEAPGLLRLPLGLLAVLVLPGWAITLAVFPSSRDLLTVERFGLSMGLSLAVVSVLILALHHTPFGVHPSLAVAIVTASIVGTAGVAWWRSGPDRDRTASIPWRILPPRRLLQGASTGPALLLAAALLAAGGILAWSLQPSRLTEFTEFFVLGPDGLAADYPRRARPGEPVALTVGITSHEAATITYAVRVEAAGRNLATTGPIVLPPGQTWQQVLTVSLPEVRDPEVRLLLFREDAPEPYRLLRLWIDSATY